jgi:hypothetical protein
MDYQELKKRVKSSGQRITKDVKGKRVRLTSQELRKKVRRDMMNRVNDAKQTLGMCKSLLNVTKNRRVPTPPPPPPRKVQTNVRQKLIAELKANLKRRGISKN